MEATTIKDNFSALVEKYGGFFAFNDKQLKEQRKEGVEYVRYYAGLLLPKENVKQFDKEFKNL